MTISRYVRVGVEEVSISNAIYQAVQNNEIDYKTVITSSGDRLDHMAFKEYQNGTYWWIIAAASGVGWWLQVPEGVVIRIPTNLSQIENL